MDAHEVADLKLSRENWRVVAITLMLVVSAVLISCISYMIGKSNAIKYISDSGYTVTLVHTPTNFFYVVEGVKSHAEN